MRKINKVLCRSTFPKTGGFTRQRSIEEIESDLKLATAQLQTLAQQFTALQTQHATEMLAWETINKAEETNDKALYNQKKLEAEFLYMEKYNITDHLNQIELARERYSNLQTELTKEKYKRGCAAEYLKTAGNKALRQFKKKSHVKNRPSIDPLLLLMQRSELSSSKATLLAKKDAKKEKPPIPANQTQLKSPK